MPDEPEAAAPGAPTTPAPPETSTAPETSRLPRPSRRQVWLTVAVAALVAAIGTIAVINKSNSGSTGAAETPTPLTTLAAVPESNSQASEDAAALEVRVRQAIGGCWDEAEPGNADGAYRQDYHFPEGKNCGGSGWDIDIQIFATTKQAAAAAAHLTGARTRFVGPYNLIVLGAGATAAVRQAVATQPGVRPAA